MGAELHCSRSVEEVEHSQASQGDLEGTEPEHHHMQPGCMVQDILLKIQGENTLH